MSSQAASGNIVPILLPQAGNSMEEGTITAWRVKPGDNVKVGDILYEMETDKATIEVEAEVAGRLSRIVVQSGETVAVKAPVAYLGDDDAAVAAFIAGSGAVSTPVASVATDATVITAVTSSAVALPAIQATRKRVSPVARKAAAELGVDVESISVGSGPDGRVLLEDVKAAVGKSMPAPKAGPIQVPAGMSAIKANSGGSRVPMSKMRKAIGKNLSISKQTLPHWYTKVTIDADPMIGYYKREKALYPCSLNDVIVLAVSRVVMELPLFRAQIDGDDLVQFDSANIGLAVGMEEGLVVPVVRGADTRNLKGIAQETRRVIESAKTGKLEGVGEGVFTISNLGMFGVEEFVAIINPPESGILSVGAVREEVVVKDGAFRLGHKLTLVLSADHRIIDGTMAAKFAARLKELLENPGLLG